MEIGLGMLFFIIHILSDFYFFDRQNKKYIDILINALFYQVLLLLLVIFTGLNSKLMVTVIVIGIIHYIISSFMFIIQTNRRLNHTWIKMNSFFIEQFLHILIISLGLWYLSQESFSYLISINTYYIRLILVFLLIGKPSNILFKKIFLQFKPVNESATEDRTYKNAGAAIGTLERILIMICLISGLYSSIGLILTAKSIARYNRISTDPEFSEYYLLGTLSSVLFTIIIYILCFQFI